MGVRLLPGSVQDNRADWVWGILAEPEAAGPIALADQVYQDAAQAKVPYKGKNKPESQKAADRADAKLRSPGERADAQLKTRRILCKLRSCPGALASSPRPSTHCRSGRQTEDEKAQWRRRARGRRHCRAGDSLTDHSS